MRGNKKETAMKRMGGLGRCAVGVAVACVICVLGLGQATAQTVYTVAGVEVDANAETAAAARNIALANGQREAVRRLLRRLTPRSRHEQLPVLDLAESTPLVASMEIQEEKRSTTRYLANLKFHFNKNSVRRLLRQSAIPFSETPSKPALVLPIYESAGARNLWDEPNPWRAAWRGVDVRDRFVPLVVPRGDLADVGTISVDQALQNDPDRIRAIALRYDVEDVVIVHGVMTQDLSAGVPRLSVTVRRMGPAADSTIVESFTGASRGAMAELLTFAAKEIAATIEEDWKHATRLEFGDQGRLSVSAPLSGLGDWITLRKRLNDAAAIEHVELRELTRRRAWIIVHHLGDPESLSVALSQRDLSLVQEEGFWIVRMSDKAKP